MWIGTAATAAEQDAERGRLGTDAAASVAPKGLAASDPATEGAWAPRFDLDLQAIHTLHLPTGKVLLWAKGNARTHDSRTRIYDPATGDQRDIIAEHTALFCGGQAGMADGRFIVGGGAHSAEEVGGLTREVGVFNPWTERWRRVADLNCIRWYPSVTTMADGRIAVFNGRRDTSTCADAPEIYDPATDTWTHVTAAPRRYSNYPRVFLDPRGDLAIVGKGAAGAIFKVATETYRKLPTSFASGAAAMYLPGKVIKSGTDNGSPTGATNTAAVIDLNSANPAFRIVSPMLRKRNRHTMKVLPTGEVLVVGGFDENRLPVLEPEIWNPDTEQWRLLAPMSVPRLYHSTTLLWRDGRVLSAGGQEPHGLKETGEWYSPPYLFRGPRPVITAAPASITWAGAFTVSTPDTAAVARISLLRLDAGTHAFDGNQRFTWLDFARTDASTLTVQAPPDANVAPPGYYQLFLLSAEGVPSISEYVRIGTPTDVLARDDEYEALMDTPLAVAAPGVLGNDTGSHAAPLSAVLVAGPGHGSLDLRADGSFTYTPADGFSGADTFTYRARLEASESDTATVTIMVGMAPVVAIDDAYGTDANTPLSVVAPGVLGNDEGHHAMLAAVLETGPASGTLALDSDGAFVYTPAEGFSGTDTFMYRASDGITTSDPAVVTITVAPVTDPGGAAASRAPVVTALPSTEPD